MQAEQWQKIEQIFNEAVALPENQRVFFIAEKSSGDVELKEEVLSLIAEIERDENFLTNSVFDLGAKLFKKELKTVITQPEFDSHELQKLLGYVT